MENLNTIPAAVISETVANAAGRIPQIKKLGDCDGMFRDRISDLEALSNEIVAQAYEDVINERLINVFNQFADTLERDIKAELAEREERHRIYLEQEAARQEERRARRAARRAARNN